EALPREPDPARPARGLAVLEDEDAHDLCALAGERVELRLGRVAEHERELERHAQLLRVVARPRELVPPAVLAEAELGAQVREPQRPQQLRLTLRERLAVARGG